MEPGGLQREVLLMRHRSPALTPSLIHCPLAQVLCTRIRTRDPVVTVKTTSGFCQWSIRNNCVGQRVCLMCVCVCACVVQAARKAMMSSEDATPMKVTAGCRQSVTNDGGFSPCPLNFSMKSLHQFETSPVHDALHGVWTGSELKCYRLLKFACT